MRARASKFGIKYHIAKLTGYSLEESEHMFEVVLAGIILQIIERGSVKLDVVNLFLEVNAKNELFLTRKDTKIFDRVANGEEGLWISKYLQPKHVKRLIEFKEHYGKLPKDNSSEL